MTLISVVVDGEDQNVSIRVITMLFPCGKYKKLIIRTNKKV